MKRLHGILFFLLLTASESVWAQASGDSSFSLLFNTSISFTHANDPHINRWLEKYGYPTEPHVPSSLNLEIAAIPVASSLMYSIKLSTITSGKNFSSFNILGGLYSALIKKPDFLLYLGGGAGFHCDIITLNGNMPADYMELARQHGTAQLALRRAGLFIEPAVKAFWYPLRIHNVQVGLFGGLGYDLDFNSRWRLGYYNNNHGQYSHFRGLKKPEDQRRVSEYGFSFNAGVSIRLNLH